MLRDATPDERDEARELPREYRHPLLVAATPELLVYAHGEHLMAAPIGKPARWLFRGAIVARGEWFKA